MEMERYYLEQQAIPEMLYSDNCQPFLMSLLQDRGDFLVYMLTLIGAETGSGCSYRADQFVFKPQLFSGEDKSRDIAILTIDMPEPEEMPLCAKIIICHDAMLSNPRYYTVEKSVGDNKFMLCGVNEEGRHLNFGNCPENEEELFYKILGFYRNHLSGIENS